MPKRERHGWPALEIAAQEAIGRHAEIEGSLGGVFDDGRPVFLGEREHTEDATDARFPFMSMDVIAEVMRRDAPFTAASGRSR